MATTQQSANQTEDTFTSVSSLASSEMTIDRGLACSDTSPMSTLTGKLSLITQHSFEVFYVLINYRAEQSDLFV